jgi:hypothetical protein
MIEHPSQGVFLFLPRARALHRHEYPLDRRGGMPQGRFA